MRARPGIVLAILMTFPGAGFAQELSTPVPALPPKAFVDVNLIGMANSPAKPRQFNGRFVTFGEAGLSRVTYPKPSTVAQLPSIDIGAGYMTGTLIGLSVNLSRSTFNDGAVLSATVPHPLVLNASGTADGVVTNRELKRRETMLALNSVTVPLRTERAEARIMIGAAYFWLNADMVNSVSYSQASTVTPLTNTIAITGFTAERGKGHGLGFTLGGDYTHFFTRMIGARAGLRYSYANVQVHREPLSKIEQHVRVGGLMVFLGARFRFDR